MLASTHTQKQTPHRQRGGTNNQRERKKEGEIETCHRVKFYPLQYNGGLFSTFGNREEEKTHTQTIHE